MGPLGVESQKALLRTGVLFSSSIEIIGLQLLARHLRLESAARSPTQIVTSEASKFRYARNSQVRFQVRDVYIPGPARILEELHGEDEIEGNVVDFSESGEHGEAFVVVEVKGLAQPVVVPIKCIKSSL